MNELPRHIAIIMDGNGRWAKKRDLPRSSGHRAGGEAAQEIIRTCSEKGIEVLTMWAFGTENWNRPVEEVNYLMKLFFDALQRNIKDLQKYNMQLRVIGDCERLDKKLQNKIIEAQQLSTNNTGLKLNVGISYSGRWDILQAVKKLARSVETGELKAEQITQEHFQSLLCLHDLPEPDLLIRTSGELRISNFMLWQLAYTELYFTDILWPDFHKDALEDALRAYTRRERRFGKL